jgi:hypothetical protein
VRERAAAVFPFVLSAALPLAGLVLAGLRYAEGDREYGTRLALAALLGVFAWMLVLTA